jgi:oligosaccharyltransferase complex subunit alpha (ribophorin I)
MRTSTFVPALLGLLSFAAAKSTIAKSTWTPTPSFKNINLVHVISLEKNYVKESVNVLIEGVDDKPQDEYFLPFSTDQMSRIGGVEVKDRKDPKNVPFEAEPIEIDPDR